MYKLLVVDDEQDIRQGIVRSIPWNEWGFEVSGQGKNGEDAVRLVQTLEPHVVLSDIRMPKMDGIELMQYLHQNYPQVKIIILSGYNDVEYLNMSIKNNVTEYLLKPTDLDEFEALFKKVKNKLDEEKKKKTELETLKQSEKQGKFYQYDRVLNNLLRGYLGSDWEKKLKEELEEAGLDFNNCLITAFDIQHSDKDKSREYDYIMKEKIINYCNSREGTLHYQFFLSGKQKIIGIISAETMKSNWKQQIVYYIQELQIEVEDIYGIDMFAGVSEICESQEHLPRLYDQALQCVNQKIFVGTLSIVLYPELKEAEAFEYYVSSFDQEKIRQWLINGDAKAIENELRQVFGMFENRLIKDYDYINRICMECFYNIIRWALISFQLRIEVLLEAQGVHFADIYQKESLGEKRSFLYSVLQNIMTLLKEVLSSGKKNNTLAQNIKEYLDKEYCSNLLSLENVADRVKKNPAYISKLFKKETGFNFSDYITQKRMEKSKEYLKDFSLKIYEIAEMTGYADASNFIKVFKKNCGLSPNEYRSLFGGNS